MRKSDIEFQCRMCGMTKRVSTEDLDAGLSPPAPTQAVIASNDITVECKDCGRHVVWVEIGQAVPDERREREGEHE